MSGTAEYKIDHFLLQNNCFYEIDHFLLQNNCFWFEPKTLCKHPNGTAVCIEEICPVLKGRKMTIKTGEEEK